MLSDFPVAARLVLLLLVVAVALPPHLMCKRSRTVSNDWFVVADAGLHIREAPHAAAKSLGLLPYGARVLYLGQSTERDDQGIRWLEVEHKGLKGWASGDALNTAAIDPERLQKRDFKGLVLYTAPSSMQLQGGQLLGSHEGTEYGFSHYKHRGADVFLLERKLRYVADRVEWSVVDALVLDPGASHLLDYGQGDNCRDADGRSLHLFGETTSAGSSPARDGAALTLVRGWQVDLASRKFKAVDVKGVTCASAEEP